MKTIAFEIAEQMTRMGAAPRAGVPWAAPDWYVQAVSGGIGPLGVLKGFRELAAAGIIDRVPKIAVVQTKGCNPMVRAWEKGKDEVEAVDQPDSLITVLATGNPGMAYRILKHAADTNGGAMVDVSDGEAFRAMRRVARIEGLSMEPAASVAFAGLDKLLERDHVQPGEQVVVNCSGHTFSAEKYALEDRYIFNLQADSSDQVRPTEGLATTLEELDERITTVAIIDDNPYDSRLIRRFLDRYRNYRVFEANTAKDGLDLVRQRQPDLVMLDLMMPEMDGFTMTDALKSDARTAHIPIVIVSAKTLVPEERAKLDQYAESVWQKGSFSVKALVQHVVDIVEEGQGVVESDAAASPDDAASQEIPAFGEEKRQQLLVIDNYAPEARLLRRLLQTLNYVQVLEAHSGAQAQAVVEQVPPDLIVLDMDLPDIDGEELIDKLRQHEPTRTTPVMIIAGQDDLSPEVRARVAPHVDSIWVRSALDRSSFLTHVQAILSE
jgi:CheY-like chemotaxis protein